MFIAVKWCHLLKKNTSQLQFFREFISFKNKTFPFFLYFYNFGKSLNAKRTTLKFEFWAWIASWQTLFLNKARPRQLKMNYYAWKMGAPRYQCFSPQINNWHFEKIKILGAVLELPARQQCQSSLFTAKMGQMDWIGWIGNAV